MLLADSIQILLESDGFSVDTANDGESGLAFAELGIYDLVILDIMLPKMDGYEISRRLRKRHIGVPILMLTARSDVSDRVEGLNSGADYYLSKPFHTKELLACVHALLRRQGAQVDELVYGNTSLDLNAKTLSAGAHQIRLSAKEFDVMRLLMIAQNGNVDKETILSKVWGYDSNAVENNVEVYIGFLRKKLRKLGSNLSIVSIRCVGYHLEVGR